MYALDVEEQYLPGCMMILSICMTNLSVYMQYESYIRVFMCSIATVVLNTTFWGIKNRSWARNLTFLDQQNDKEAFTLLNY